MQVPAATLSQYAGTYDIHADADGTKHFAILTQEDADLWLDYDGKGRELLIALSPARFSWSGTIVEFSPATGGGMNITLHYAENSDRGVRRR